jgi:hypothetical protein
MTEVAVTGLNWNLIAIGIVAPALVAVLVAYPFWRKEQMIFGNVVGTAVLFASAVALIFREYVEIDLITKRCLDQGQTCFPEPDSFTRFGIYASVGLLQIFGLFYVSIKVEEHKRRQLYSPEWRR